MLQRQAYNAKKEKKKKVLRLLLVFMGEETKLFLHLLRATKY